MVKHNRRIVLAGLLSTFVLGQAALVTTPDAYADGEKDKKTAERESIDQQLEDLTIELDDVNDDLRQTYLDLAETELLIPQAQDDLDVAREEQRIAEEDYQKISDRLTAAKDEERELAKKVDEGQEEVDRSSDEMSQLALESYKGGTDPNPASVYVGADDPQDTVDRSMNYRITMASQGTRLDDLRTDQAISLNSQDRLEAVREEIEDLTRQAEETLTRKEEATKRAEDAKRALDSLYEDQKKQRDNLESKKAQYETDRTGLQNRGSELDQEIADLAAKERQNASTSSAPAPNSGGFIRPVSGRLNSNFGWRVHPVYRTRKFHGGVDFPAACGTPVRATASGKVVRTGYNGAAGNKVLLSHGMHNGQLLTSSYHHLQGFAVSAGQSVNAGDVVGYVGTTGTSTGCHLHFETHLDGSKVNPTQFIG